MQELVLDLTIAASHNNSRYTCRVSQGTFMGSRMITIRTGRKFSLQQCVIAIRLQLFNCMPSQACMELLFVSLY